MNAALVLAVALLAEPAVPPPQSAAGPAQVFRDFCVGTGLRRDAFEALARQRRFRAARVISSGDQPGWNLVFRGEGVVVMLSKVGGVPHEDAALGSVCSVSADRAGPGLPAEIEALASEIGLEAEPLVDIPGTAHVRTWSKFGGQTLSYATIPSDPRAVISLSRQTVTPGSQTSPPGN